MFALAFCLFAALTTLNFALTLGLVRWLRRQELGRDGVQIALPEPGRSIRQFQTSTSKDEAVTDHAFATGRYLVAFMTAGCPACQQAKCELASRRSDVPLVSFVALSPGLPARDTEQMIEELEKLGTVAVMEPHSGDSVRDAFGVEGYPTLLSVADGRVEAAGLRLREVEVLSKTRKEMRQANSPLPPRSDRKAGSGIQRYAKPRA